MFKSHISRRAFLGGLSAATSALVTVPTALASSLSQARGGRRIQPESMRVGDLFQTRRTLPAPGLADLDPFLLVDHFDFFVAPGAHGGIAPHPHRGFEAVTVLFDGVLAHRDSRGGNGQTGPGDVQWLTAGSGIAHMEEPSNRFRRHGGRLHGLQLWVNLPGRLKMTPPRYQTTRAAAVPVVNFRGVRARILAGAAYSVPAPISTHTPVLLIDYALAPGARVTLPLSPRWTAFAHVVDGAVSLPDARRPHRAGDLIAFDNRGYGVDISNTGTVGARVLVGAGEPIGEPIARWGPFVMNSGAQLQQAIADWRGGRIGRVAGPY